MARLYADENFSLAVVEELRHLGHDVSTVLERVMCGAPRPRHGAASKSGLLRLRNQSCESDVAWRREGRPPERWSALLDYAVRIVSDLSPEIAACAAASRAIGTR